MKARKVLESQEVGSLEEQTTLWINRPNKVSKNRISYSAVKQY
jgi:hypothetical protein